MEFRLVNTEDVKELLYIYGQYIDTTITFEYTLPTEEVFRKRVEDISSEYPYIVCVENGKIIGYAYAHRNMEREAYGWNVEFSIYLDKNVTAKGIGTRMYNILTEIVKLQGVRNIYALVTYPNDASERLHTKLGFELLVTFKNDGFKNGQWKDVMWFRKNIASYDKSVEHIKYIYQLDKKVIEEILNKG